MAGNNEDRAEALAGKILTAAAVAAAAWLIFQGAVRGIFSAMMGGNSENGVYVLFYGGYVVLAVMAAIGAAAAWLFWRAVRRPPAPPGGQAPERSMLRSGLAMGFALVAGTALMLLALFFWTLRAAS